MVLQPAFHSARVAALLSILAAGPAAAEPATQTCAGGAQGETGVPVALAAELWAWVADRSGLAEGSPPEVCVVSPATLDALGGAAALAGPLDLEAAYLEDRHLVMVRAPWQAASIADRSILVHEFVHHAQALAGARVACLAEAERAAYAAQSDWLAAHGTDLETAFGIDRLTLLVLTTCGI